MPIHVNRIPEIRKSLMVNDPEFLVIPVNFLFASFYVLTKHTLIEGLAFCELAQEPWLQAAMHWVYQHVTCLGWISIECWPTLKPWSTPMIPSLLIMLFLLWHYLNVDNKQQLSQVFSNLMTLTRQDLFDIPSPLTLTLAQYEELWPFVDHVWRVFYSIGYH